MKFLTLTALFLFGLNSFAAETCVYRDNRTGTQFLSTKPTCNAACTDALNKCKQKTEDPVKNCIKPEGVSNCKETTT